MSMGEILVPGVDSMAKTLTMNSYFPSIPPRPPQAVMSYTRSVLEAPHTALLGVSVDGRQPAKHPVTPRCRMRSQVGSTNRWRLPEFLGSDLLGTAQAMKATIPLSYRRTAAQFAACASRPSLSAPRPTDPASSPPPRSLSCGAASRDVMARLTRSHTLPVAQPTTLKGCPPLPTFTPHSARQAQPSDIFQYHSKRSHTSAGPGSVPVQSREHVLLQCVGLSWELHRPFLQKSGTLATLLENAKEAGPKVYYRSPCSDKLDSFIDKNKYYNTEYKRSDAIEPSMEQVPEYATQTGDTHIDQLKHTSEQRISNKTMLTLDVDDEYINQKVFAIALGNLYHEQVEVDQQDVVGVLAAACVLNFTQLINGCTQLMLRSISGATVCTYYDAAAKFHQDQVKTACERWLEVNLVTKLSSMIQLRQLSMELLQKILKSNRLFTYGEFSLYRVLATWVFMQLNPQLQLMPTYNCIIAFFNSLPKGQALIEREEGQQFAALFMCLRLQGVIDTNHLVDIQTMNIVPQSWIVKILAQHYYSLQGGGDMSLMTNFNSGAIRQGFVLDDEPHYHSEVLSLHGFHFELKAVRESKNNVYSFFLQRLKHNDPILSFRQCERHTFSMRSDRDVKYSICVQWFDADGQCLSHCSGMLSQRFGLGAKSSRSEVVTLEHLRTPIHVTYALLFPPS